MLTRTCRGINEGRQAAREVDLYLEKCTNLPVTGGIVRRTAEEVFAAGAGAGAAVAVEPVAA
jgi:glutamate synthase (NADPH/NADH)